MQLNSFGFAPEDLALEDLDQTQAAVPPASRASSHARTEESQQRGHLSARPSLTHLDDQGMAHMVDVGQVTPVISTKPMQTTPAFSLGRCVVTATGHCLVSCSDDLHP